jgi:hypothetical protein
MSRKKGIKQLITYIFNESKMHTETQKPIIIRKNIRTKTLEKNIKEFELNEAKRIMKSKNSVAAYHSVISFHAGDTASINEKILKDITKQYISLKGNDALYLATVHLDKTHVHIHLAESGTKYLTGKANRISKQAFTKLKIDLEVYQRTKYPELTKSKVNHAQKHSKEIPSKEQRHHQKATLQALVRDAFSNSKNQEMFVKQVQDNGHIPYFRNGTLTGIQFEGDRKYRLSTLGYSKEQVSEMYQIDTKETEALDELASLRNQSKSMERETEGRSRTMEIEEEANEEEIENEIDYER